MIRIGKIVATHGISGAMILTHLAGSSKWLKKGDVLHLEMQKGSYIPYFIATIKAVNNEEYLITAEDINKVEDARKLVTRHVYVNENLLADLARQSPLLWIGFDITDKNYGALGKIEDVMQTGKQWLAKTTYKDTEVLLPLIDQTITGLDIKTRTIQLDLPEGLLEVYLDA